MNRDFKQIGMLAMASLVLGTGIFMSCSKERNLVNEPSSETTIQNPKSTDDLYNSFLSNHDFSINIVGNNINSTAFGRLDTNIMGVMEYKDEVLSEGMQCITDENAYSISKINSNRAEFHVENMTSDSYRFILDDVKQNGDTLNFSLKHNDTHLAYCTFKLPEEIGNFMDILPITLNENAKISPTIIRILKAAGSFLIGVGAGLTTEALTGNNDKDEDTKAAESCYEYMHIQASMCYNAGGLFSAHHTPKHVGCSHSCNK